MISWIAGVLAGIPAPQFATPAQVETKSPARTPAVQEGLAPSQLTAQPTAMRMLIFIAALLAAPAANAHTLDDLAWLKGCWRMSANGTVITEVWSAPPMPALLGYAYTTRNGELREWEQTRIAMIDGAPTYVAMPMGAPQTLFRLREDSPPNTARFYNADHDFPNTVEYRREGDTLYASVYGDHSDHRQDFRYRRIRCESALRP